MKKIKKNRNKRLIKYENVNNIFLKLLLKEVQDKEGDYLKMFQDNILRQQYNGIIDSNGKFYPLKNKLHHINLWNDDLQYLKEKEYKGKNKWDEILYNDCCVLKIDNLQGRKTIPLFVTIMTKSDDNINSVFKKRLILLFKDLKDNYPVVFDTFVWVKFTDDLSSFEEILKKNSFEELGL